MLHRNAIAPTPVRNSRRILHSEVTRRRSRAAKRCDDVVYGFHTVKLRQLRSACQRQLRSESCDMGIMDSVHDRLKAARIRAGFSTPTDAARAFGWKVPTYLGHENGDRKPKRDRAEKYARAFRTTVAWLLDGTAPNTLNKPIPVFGYIGLGEEIEMLDVEASALDHIELPYGFSVPDCAALIARGNSQFPRVRDGEVVVYHTGGLPPDDLLGREVVVKVMDGAILLKTIRKGSGPGLYHLESFNAPTRTDVRIDWCGEVLSIVPGGAWRKLR